MVTQAVSQMSDAELIRGLFVLSHPLIKELARRGYDVNLSAPHEQAADGLDAGSFYTIQKPDRSVPFSRL